MKNFRFEKPIADPPFLKVVRLIFVMLFTYITFRWASTHPFITNPQDWWNYTYFGFLIAVVLVLIESQIKYAFPQELMVGLFGMLCGLSASALIQIGLPQNLTSDLSRMMLHLFLGYYGVVVALRYAHRIDFSAAKFFTRSEDRLYGAKFLDTSILIDGRIVEIIESRFIEGLMIIPSFVINELQILSDSDDHIKRSRGRRGLDISKRLQSMPKANVEILEEDFPNLVGVDKKLVSISKKYEGTLVTMDFNLSKVAELDNIPIMNINSLAQSLRMVFLPGEEIQVQLLREGKESHQAVAYLDDGTMVVVEQARKLIGKSVEVVVASVLQTSAGRMIFAKMKDQEDPDKSSKLELEHSSGHLVR